MSSSAPRTSNCVPHRSCRRSIKCSTHALDKRIDIGAEEARVAAAEQSQRVARSGRWPDLSLSAGYSSGYSSLSPFNFNDQLDQRRGGSVGLNLSLPLFDRQEHRQRGAAC